MCDGNVNRIMVALIGVLILLSSVGAVTLQQQAYAPRTCGGCGEFQKATGQFVINVVNEVLQAPPEPDTQQKLALFRVAANEFMIDVLEEPDSNFNYDGGDTLLHDKISRIFLGGPDTIPELLDNYLEAGRTVLGLEHR
jgi:hypothetical protein